jgi:hypothetical protein
MVHKNRPEDMKRYAHHKSWLTTTTPFCTTKRRCMKGKMMRREQSLEVEIQEHLNVYFA